MTQPSRSEVTAFLEGRAKPTWDQLKEIYRVFLQRMPIPKDADEMIENMRTKGLPK